MSCLKPMGNLLANIHRVSVLASQVTPTTTARVCPHKPSVYHNIYDPGISPGSANQCILGDVYLRSNLSMEPSMSQAKCPRPIDAYLETKEVTVNARWWQPTLIVSFHWCQVDKQATQVQQNTSVCM